MRAKVSHGFERRAAFRADEVTTVRVHQHMATKPKSSGEAFAADITNEFAVGPVGRPVVPEVPSCRADSLALATAVGSRFEVFLMPL